MPVEPTRMAHATLLPVSRWAGGRGHGVHVVMMRKCGTCRDRKLWHWRCDGKESGCCNLWGSEQLRPCATMAVLQELTLALQAETVGAAFGGVGHCTEGSGTAGWQPGQGGACK